jgi:hypothetical protein
MNTETHVELGTLADEFARTVYNGTVGGDDTDPRGAVANAAAGRVDTDPRAAYFVALDGFGETVAAGYVTPAGLVYSSIPGDPFGFLPVRNAADVSETATGPGRAGYFYRMIPGRRTIHVHGFRSAAFLARVRPTRPAGFLARARQTVARFLARD